MREITPPIRTQNFTIRTNDVVPGFSDLVFKFQTDSILHYIFGEFSFICPTGTFASISINLGSAGTQGFADDLRSTALMKFSHANLHATVQFPTANFQNTIQLNNTLVRSSQELHITRNTLSSAGQSSSIVGNVTLGFSVLSEWVNFRQPGIAVRL